MDVIVLAGVYMTGLVCGRLLYGRELADLRAKYARLTDRDERGRFVKRER